MAEAGAPPPARGRPALVIDTNIALDLFVFHDPATAALRQAVDDALPVWLATDAMREELARVLDYPQIRRRLTQQERAAQQVLAAFDRCVRLVPVASKAPYTCKDPDDQKFIDLAVAHRAALLSKDAAVLCMARRLARLGVAVHRQWTDTDISANHVAESPHGLVSTSE